MIKETAEMKERTKKVAGVIKEVFDELGVFVGKAYKFGTDAFMAFTRMYRIHNIVEIGKDLLFSMFFGGIAIAFLCIASDIYIKWVGVVVFGITMLVFLSCSLDKASKAIIPEYHIITKIFEKLQK
jgi:hypothetical protein